MAVSKSFLGSAVDPATGPAYTFSGITLQTGRIVVACGARAGGAGVTLTITSVVVDGVTATEVVTTQNTDAAGISRGALYVVDLASVSTNNIVVTWASTGTVVRSGIGVWKIIDTNSATPFHTGSDAPSGTGAVATDTIDTPADGVLIAYEYMCDGTNHKHSGGSILTSAETARTVSATSSGAGGNITWVGVTEDFEAIIEANITGEGALVLASWAPVSTGRNRYVGGGYY